MKDKMSDETKYELNVYCRQLKNDLTNLMELLRKQDEDKKPILYEGRHIQKIILPVEEYQKMCQRLESIDNAKPSEITLRELVSKHILNPNSVVDVFEQDKNEPHYSNRIFMGMAWEMENHEIGNRKLKYIFSAVAETISESDRVCIEVK